MTISDLIRRLEAATGPDRELDAELAVASGKYASRAPTGKGIGVLREGHRYWEAPPRYTGSIDSALTLIPPGWAWSVEHSTEYGSYGGCSPKAPHDEWVHSDMGGSGIYAATPAIALCIAALRARAVTMMDDADNKKPPVPRRTGAVQGLSA